MKRMSRLIAVLIIIMMIATLSVSCKRPRNEEDEAVSGTYDGTGVGTEGTDDQGDDVDGSGGSSGDTGTGGSTGDSSDGTGTGGSTGGTISGGSGHSSYTEDEDGKVISTKDDLTTDENYHITSAVTNDNGFIPDEEQGLEKSERRATEASKYDFDKNPLINRDRQYNKTDMPSFNIDDTGFVRAGTKLADLKNKNIFFITADNFAIWSYRDEKGSTIDEWDWYKLLKNDLGFNVKYTVKQHQASLTAQLQYMNAGKQLDLIYTDHSIAPMSFCLTRSITELVNINNLGSSPGICKKTMDITKWGNTYRLIAPIGLVDVLWYNQTLAQELGLSDPHTMWENGVWNWDSWKSFLLSAPKKTKIGDNLTAFVSWTIDCAYVWPSSNGEPYIHIDPDAKVPTLIDNWSSPKTLETWEFYTGTVNSISYGTTNDAHLGLYKGTSLMSMTMYTQVYRDTEYSKHVQINWVPMPKSNSDTGVEACQYMGFGMMLPKRTARAENVDVTLKFMELWATRFTEALFDNLNLFEYYNFNYKQRKQYFDFVTQHVAFGLMMNNFAGSSLDSDTNWRKCFSGSAAYNVKTETQKAANLVHQYVIDAIKYGQ